MNATQLSEWAIYIGGMHSLAFAVFHVFFWRLFDWKNDLSKLKIANRAIIQIFNVLGIFLFLFMAFVCFGFKNELIETPLGKVILAFFSGFWAIRLVLQFVFLPYNNWLIHLLNVLFLLGAVAFLVPFLGA